MNIYIYIYIKIMTCKIMSLKSLPDKIFWEYTHTWSCLAFNSHNILSALQTHIYIYISCKDTCTSNEDFAKVLVYW